MMLYTLGVWSSVNMVSDKWLHFYVKANLFVAWSLRLERNTFN